MLRSKRDVRGNRWAGCKKCVAETAAATVIIRTIGTATATKTTGWGSGPGYLFLTEDAWAMNSLLRYNGTEKERTYYTRCSFDSTNLHIK